VQSKRSEWAVKILSWALVGFCASPLGGQQPFLRAEQRVMLAPPAGKAVGTKLAAVPQPNLNDIEGTVKEQIESAWSELEVLIRAPAVSEEELAEGYGQMGKVFHAYAFSDAAAACYQNASVLAPQEFSWVYYLGRLRQETGQITEGIPYLTKAQELRPTEVPILINLAEAYLSTGQPGSAKAAFERALALDSSSVAALAGLGRIALSSGDFTKAVSSLEEALKLQPQATSLHYPLAMAYRGKGDVANALGHLQKQGPDKPEVPDRLMDDLERLKKGEMILWRRGNQAMHEGRHADAVKLYEQMVSLAENDPLPRIYLGNALAALGDLRGATEQYRQVLLLRPNNATAHYNLGVILLQLKSDEEAIKHLAAAVASDPGLKLAHFQLANISMRSRLYEQAISHYTRVIELSPDNEFARLMKSMALIGLQRYAEAKGELEESVATFPESTDLTSALARVLAACPNKSLRDGPRALRLVEKLLKAHPSPDFELAETYGMALASAGRISAAADLQRRMIATVEEAGRPDLAAALKRNLQVYEQGQACSLPWRDDDPIFAPQPGKMTLITPKESLRMVKAGSVSP
jgi:tetratricopeptide (TPR) repeat protein